MLGLDLGPFWQSTLEELWGRSHDTWTLQLSRVLAVHWLPQVPKVKGQDGQDGESVPLTTFQGACRRALHLSVLDLDRLPCEALLPQERLWGASMAEDYFFHILPATVWEISEPSRHHWDWVGKRVQCRTPLVTSGFPFTFQHCS